MGDQDGDCDACYSCSRVQPFIYYHIRISFTYDADRKIQRMVNHLAEFPHLSPLVKDIAVDMLHDRSREVFSLFPNISSLILDNLLYPDVSVEAFSSHVYLTLSALRNLRQLSLGASQLPLSSFQRLIESCPSFLVQQGVAIAPFQTQRPFGMIPALQTGSPLCFDGHPAPRA